MKNVRTNEVSAAKKRRAFTTEGFLALLVIAILILSLIHI